MIKFYFYHYFVIFNCFSLRNKKILGQPKIDLFKVLTSYNLLPGCGKELDYRNMSFGRKFFYQRIKINITVKLIECKDNLLIVSIMSLVTNSTRMYQ